jgi:hypothetical protein
MSLNVLQILLLWALPEGCHVMPCDAAASLPQQQ